MFSLPFFILLFGAGLASMEAKAFHSVIKSGRYELLPSWVLNPKAELTFTVLNLPLYWSNFAFMIYGLFILPWYTVLACVIADLIAGGVFHALFLRPIERRLGVFLALLSSYLVVLVTTIWYFGFARR
jgi:hypothetical protein